MKDLINALGITEDNSLSEIEEILLGVRDFSPEYYLIKKLNCDSPGERVVKIYNHIRLSNDLSEEDVLEFDGGISTLKVYKYNFNNGYYSFSLRQDGECNVIDLDKGQVIELIEWLQLRISKE